jgi:hypothetical protein
MNTETAESRPTQGERKNNESPSGQTQTAEPPLAAALATRIESIYRGTTTAPDKLNVPTAPVPEGCEVIGTVTDPIARELFSLTVDIRIAAREARRQFSPPGNSKLAVLENQDDMVNNMFWVQTAKEIPAAEVVGKEVGVYKDWQVAIQTQKPCKICGRHHEGAYHGELPPGVQGALGELLMMEILFGGRR